MSQTCVSGHLQSTESLVNFYYDDPIEEIVTIGKFLTWVGTIELINYNLNIVLFRYR